MPAPFSNPIVPNRRIFAILGAMFFFLSKLLWFFAMPLNLAVFALTAAMVAMHKKRHRVARACGIAAWGILVVFGVLPTGRIMLEGLENRYEAPAPMPPRVHGIVVLGGAVDSDIGLSRGAPQLNGAADRIGTFADLARRYPWARLVYTGGVGTLSGKGTAEAQMARAVLATYGLNPPRNRLLVEDASRTTAENAAMAKEIAMPRPDQTWLLVTSAWHMPRALGAFRAAGWNVLPYPADYRTAGPGGITSQSGFLANMDMAHTALKEYIGICAYVLAHKWATTTQPETE